MSRLLAKITAEAEGGTKMYDELAEWCEDKFKEPCFEIKLGQCEVDQLKAEIVELIAMIDECSTKIETLTGEIAADGAEIKAATDLRAKEQTAFADGGKELVAVELASLGREMQRVRQCSNCKTPDARRKHFKSWCKPRLSVLQTHPA